MQRRSFLGVKKKVSDIDFNVTDIELEHGVSAGIYLRSLSESTIPPYEEHLCRIKANISLSAWQTMPRMEKAMIVALMQIENAVQGHQSEAEIKKAKASAPKGK